MSFYARAVIALLSGVGAGTLGFWVSWRTVCSLCGSASPVGYDWWIVGSIFAPGVLISGLVFVIVSRAGERQARSAPPPGSPA
jgi:hypothetical protein